MNSKDKRNDLYECVKKELIGPDDIKINDKNEEVLATDPPSSRYVSGILFPQKDSEYEDDQDFEVRDDRDSNEIKADEAKGIEKEPEGKKLETSFSPSEEIEECINLSNAYKQSAISLSVAIKSGDSLTAHVKCGYYDLSVLSDAPHSKAYVRHEIDKDVGEVKFDDLLVAKASRKPIFFSVKGDGVNKELSVYVFYRKDFGSGLILATFSLINENVSSAKFSDKLSFFQVELSIVNITGFSEIPHALHDAPWLSGEEKDEQEEKSLIYRDVKEYGVGHGCSPVWDDRHGSPTVVFSSFLPKYEVKAIVQGPKTHPDFSMKRFFDDADGADYTFRVIDELRNDYCSWIDGQEEVVKSLPPELLNAAKKNISKCRECLSRIENGENILKTNKMALLAFRLANKAMLLQQLHSHLSERKWVHEGNFDVLENDYDFVYPKFDDPKTWAGGEQKNGHWYPFQISFLLLCLKSIVDKESDERSDVELIWFPTGGGKTEAYLGLSAFVIFYGRLMGLDDGTCCKILMRYTLRLLTSQQYERAASLVCACEYMRAHEGDSSLGSTPITIGLWVGGTSTPNKNKKAVDELNRLTHNGTNPFVITKCPWCGAEMGPCEHNKKLTRKISGYRKIGNRGDEKVVFQCENPKCDFHSTPLPLLVVDEEIYKNPPTILIGVVDKFAQIPFNPQIRNLFGLKDGPHSGRQHPELIIQDELHLISGPLGSVVGAYEFAIDTLSSYEEDGKMIRPKIIASTATISLAKEQCRDIFDVSNEKVKIFPQPCLSSGESFFSRVDEEKNGRCYVGVYGPAASSTSTTAIRLLAILDHCKYTIDFENNSEQKDAYWTNVCYFNSLRELGQADTWVNADITEHIKTICARSNLEKTFSMPNALELTSRIGDENLKSLFDKLQISCIGSEPNYAIDICLATNMISVGIDVQRLGLMTVFGQPKTTSEYIQATSRVGRKPDDRPGLVFVLFNPGKPRDKSVFEDFQLFHSKLYSFVEPTSVSVFSPQLRKRVLPAVLLGTIDSLWCNDYFGNPKTLLEEGKFSIVEKMLLARVSSVDPEELSDTESQLKDIEDNISRNSISRFVFPPGTEINEKLLVANGLPALYNDGIFPPQNCKQNSYSAPTSMRSVDRECQPYVPDRFQKEDR